MNRLNVFVFIVSFMFVATAYSAEKQTAEVAPDNVQDLSSLLKKVKESGLKEGKENKKREKEFLLNANKQKAILLQSKRALKKTRAVTKQLKSDFDDYEEELTDLEAQLRKRMGNLGEMFGVVRQVSQDMAAIREGSLLAVELGNQSDVLNTLSESKALPSINELEALWYELQLQMTKQGEIKFIETDFIAASGENVREKIIHVGPFAAFTERGYLNYDFEINQLIELPKQPGEATLLSDYINSDEAYSAIAIDPTRGALLNLGSQSPGILDRIHQGGLIGYIIVLLAMSGFIYSLYLLVNILKTNTSVKTQLKTPDVLNLENPLGRILSVYLHQNKEVDLETLEMKLDEAVLKELPALEKGLPLIKLLAAVAPLLGLLGTVTGMIATFQSITLFGTGDPKLMAGGISQALITTVLGLVAAIPLLFMHNVVSARSRELIQILDQQSAGLIAEKALKES